jgi:hypothetical protein
MLVFVEPVRCSVELESGQSTYIENVDIHFSMWSIFIIRVRGNFSLRWELILNIHILFHKLSCEKKVKDNPTTPVRQNVFFLNMCKLFHKYAYFNIMLILNEL